MEKTVFLKPFLHLPALISHLVLQQKAPQRSSATKEQEEEEGDISQPSNIKWRKERYDPFAFQSLGTLRYEV